MQECFQYEIEKKNSVLLSYKRVKTVEQTICRKFSKKKDGSRWHQPVEFYDRISTVFRFGTFRGKDKFFTVDSTLRFYIQITVFGMLSLR